MAATPASKTILIAEDDLEAQEFYQLLLGIAGYRVLSAWSGRQTRVLVDTRAVDGVLLGYRLPDTIGLELCRDLRATLGPDVPILLVTMDRDPMLETRAYAAGATAFLDKPFDPEVLLTLLAAYVLGGGRT